MKRKCFDETISDTKQSQILSVFRLKKNKQTRKVLAKVH